MAQKTSYAGQRGRPVRAARGKPTGPAADDLPAALPGPLAVLFGLSPAGGAPAAGYSRPERRRKAPPPTRKRRVAGAKK